MGNEVSRTVLQPASQQWIAGRVETLLSHYFKPETDEKIEEAAMMDWIRTLTGFSKDQISSACDAYLKAESLRRPTPGAILNRIKEARKEPRYDRGADRSALTGDEAHTLLNRVLPTARKWVAENAPGTPLHEHGMKTLAYWGEV